MEAGEVKGESCETEKQAGELCEGNTVAEAEEMEACEAGRRSAPLKRRSKRKNVLTVVASGKAGWLAGKPSAAESRPVCVSDSSDLSHSQLAAAQVYFTDCF